MIALTSAKMNVRWLQGLSAGHSLQQVGSFTKLPNETDHTHKQFAELLAFFSSSINIFNVLGGNWDPTDKKFSSVNSYRQDLFPTCKAFPKETTTCIWFTQSHKVCKSTTVLQEVQML